MNLFLSLLQIFQLLLHVYQNIQNRLKIRTQNSFIRLSSDIMVPYRRSDEKWQEKINEKKDQFELQDPLSSSNKKPDEITGTEGASLDLKPDIIHFEQVFTATWEIKQFKTYFAEYMESSSKDGCELCPIRSYFFENGDDIDLPSKWLANLYLNPVDNEHAASTCDEDFDLHLSFKMVEPPKDEVQLFSSFRMKIHSNIMDNFCLFCNQIEMAKLQETKDLKLELKWSKMSEFFEMDESFCVTFEHYVYKNPVNWGLSPCALDMIKSFAHCGKIERDKKQFLELLETCNLLSLTGVLECLLLVDTQLDAFGSKRCRIQCQD